MSTAAAAPTAVPTKSGKKKLILIIVLALVAVLAASGGVAIWLMKKQAHAAEAADADESTGDKGQQIAKRDPNSVPVFVALEHFTVNLADRDADRYAQIGISLELQDPKAGDRIKVFMPAIRNNILMVLAHKRSSDLLERAGKEQLASEVLRETERAMGNEVDAPPGKGAHDTVHTVRA
ncbi:MAG: flagellar basal body-associated FliL family protein, partial [Rubrivivax sp.]